MKPYSAVKDKYLKYFVVRVPKKKKIYPGNTIEEIVDGSKFKEFLNKYKRRVLENQS